MNFFSKYTWSPMAILFCFMFIALGLSKLDDGGVLGWFYLLTGLFCGFVWKRPKSPPASS
jgi:hypothetical protein